MSFWVTRSDAVGETPVSAAAYIGRIGGEVSTAMFRTHPDNGEGALFDDFYPVRIDREAVRPGVLAYDIYGHVGIVYDILDDGRILVIASHPDRSVTRTTYGANFLRSKPGLGAGLKGWRPIRLDGARHQADGSYAGGRIKAAKNAEIADYSMEQFIGNRPTPDADWRYGDFVVGERSVGYYDFIRRMLASPDFAYDPVEELRHGMQTICGAVRRSPEPEPIASSSPRRKATRRSCAPACTPISSTAPPGSTSRSSTAPEMGAEIRVLPICDCARARLPAATSASAPALACCSCKLRTSSMAARLAFR